MTRLLPGSRHSVSETGFLVFDPTVVVRVSSFHEVRLA